MVDVKWARKVNRIEEYSRQLANRNETKINIQNKIERLLFKVDRVILKLIQINAEPVQIAHA